MSDDSGSQRDRATVPGFAKAAVTMGVPPTEPPDPPDALAKTAPGDEPQERSLGRFEIKAKLGEGGMGVVLLAIDPMLGRQVALKVLHAGGTEASAAARRRLLREAQGIAQLTHENVIVVHEVGTHEGRDYVAMEYVKGKTLGDWQVERPWREVLEMYLRAGRGLAAAHAAGLVHRDFKPDNVLVGDDGRVRVTDFGLVAAVGTGDLTETTEELRDRSELGVTLTTTGSIMGTPRYMPPEQHRGEPVDARADQFSFSASLYEALYRRPPFPGENYAVLRACVLAGELTPPPADSDVPPAIRDAVLRGLAHDRSKRFGSMTELLDALAVSEPPPRRRRSPVWVAAGIAGVIAGGIAVGTQLRGSAPAADPAVDVAGCAELPAAPITPAELATISERHRDVAAMLARDLEGWTSARRRICEGDPATRTSRLECLDGVMAHFRLLARPLVDELASVKQTRALDAGSFLVDPAACVKAKPPALLRTPTPIHREVMAAAVRRMLGIKIDPSVVADLGKRAKSDPCASVAARGFFGPAEGESAEASSNAAELCGDDRLRLNAALVALHETPSQGDITAQTSRLRMLEAVARRIESPDSDAAIAWGRALVARTRGVLDDWILRSEEHAAALALRGRVRARAAVMQEAIEARRQRASADDIAKIQPALDQLRAEVEKELGADDALLYSIEGIGGAWSFSRGEVAKSVEVLRALDRRVKAKHPAVPPEARAIRGVVRDGRGRPVEGAQVYTATELIDTTAGVLANGGLPGNEATTRSDGSFEVNALPTHAIIAAHGDRRSPPRVIADTVNLVVEPTTEVRGRVSLGGIQPPAVRVRVFDRNWKDVPYRLTAPIQPDGSFVLRVPRARLDFHLQEAHCERQVNCKQYDRKTLVIGEAPAAIELTTRSSRRSIDVIVRSTTSARVVKAAILVRSGRVESAPLPVFLREPGVDEIELTAQWSERVPPGLAPQIKPGDLAFSIPGVPEITATVCAVALPEIHSEEVDRRVAARDARIVVSCQTFEPSDRFVVLRVPPWPRFD